MSLRARKSKDLRARGRVVGDYGKHCSPRRGAARLSKKVTMIRSSSVLRDVAAAAATAVLALTVGLSAAVPAQADDGDATPADFCLLNCRPGTHSLADPGKGKPRWPPAETPAPPPTVATPRRTIPPFRWRPPPPRFPPSPRTPRFPQFRNADAGGHHHLRVTFGDFRESVHRIELGQTHHEIGQGHQAAAVSRNDGSGLFGSPGCWPSWRACCWWESPAWRSPGGAGTASPPTDWADGCRFMGSGAWAAVPIDTVWGPG